MEFHEEAFVLSARAHGDTGVVVDLLTETHGRHAAYVAGGASRKMKPFLQPGARVIADYRARTSDHLGSARLEAVGEGPSALFDDPLALTGLAAATAVTQGALPEREAHPGAFLAFEALMSAFMIPEVWPAIFVRFEAGLLEDLGFGLDLSRCAATGTHGRSDLRQPPHRPRRLTRGRRPLCRQDAEAAALHARRPGGAGRRRCRFRVSI
jgi:DNA repair protein RecO (recombination protein O)